MEAFAWKSRFFRLTRSLHRLSKAIRRLFVCLTSLGPQNGCRFACHAGIDEDPVTGSAHCMLTPYWAAKLNKTEMTAFQALARGGEVSVRLKSDRVILGGNAVTILRGSLIC